MTKRTLDRARRELDHGKLWRAKEILQGAIRGESYDVQLYEMMGNVFLRMGDLPEAGRFLFLSGVRRDAYLEAIELFLSKHRGKPPHEFVHLFPRKARLRTVSEYPHEVRQVLKETGFRKTVTDEDGKVYPPRDRREVVFWLTCGTIAVVVLGLIVLGVIKLIEITR